VYHWERIHWTSEGEVPDDFTEPPDIAIEIVSPQQGVNSLVRRSLWYVDNGVRIALVVDPEDRSVISFEPGMMPKAQTKSDPIDLTSVLPGFELTPEQSFSALRGEIV
jgi:Uma2 family endonuclease